MDKAAVIEAIILALRKEFEMLSNAAGEARGTASDGEHRSESKYDTRATEANYLADGQARQALTVAEAVGAFEALTAEPSAEIGLGTLVKLSLLGEAQWFFVGPASGGIEVSVEGETITVITPEAPLGGQLMGRKPGDNVKEPEAEILEVC